MAILDKLRQYKFTYWIYNLFHYRMLLHNRAAYKKYRIHRSLAASISSKDFPDKTSQAWLDRGDSRLLAPDKPMFSSFTPGLQQQILGWSANGFLMLEQFFDEATVASLNSEIEKLLRKKKLHFSHDHKLMFAHRVSPLVRQITRDNRLTEILRFLLDREVVAFQTINFLRGSSQRAHSDSIHMTTYPLGYLIAVWIALEDTDLENGPLFYYPGSHRLPYLLNNDFNQGETAFKLGKKEYPDYEDALEQLVGARQFEKRIFLARRGDAFIWHANLVHGGLPIADSERTRKSMVIHYFANDVIKYHEISERPSLLARK